MNYLLGLQHRGQYLVVYANPRETSSQLTGKVLHNQAKCRTFALAIGR